MTQGRQPQRDASRKRRRPKPKIFAGKPAVAAAAVAGAIVVGFVAAVLTMQIVKSRHTDPRLFGTWKSDADATIADMKTRRPVTDQGEEGLRKIFGKMKITYTADTITTDFDGKVESQSYQVVRKDADSVTLKAWSPLTKKDETFRIRFDGTDVYWVDSEGSNISECFRRIG